MNTGLVMYLHNHQKSLKETFLMSHVYLITLYTPVQSLQVINIT